MSVTGGYALSVNFGERAALYRKRLTIWKRQVWGAWSRSFALAAASGRQVILLPREPNCVANAFSLASLYRKHFNTPNSRPAMYHKPLMIHQS